MRTTILRTFGAMVAAVACGGEPATPSPPTESAADTDAVELEVYSRPHSVSRATPTYPLTAVRNNKEGWVRLDFMVDTDGQPYEIVVTESVGDEVFHDAAIRALEKSRFEPARFEGKPLDAGHHLYYHFEMDSSGARAWFVRIYRAAMRAIGEGDQEKADSLFEELDSSGPLNLYEDAFLHVAKSGYYATWGNEQQQLKALDRAVGHRSAEKRVPESLYTSLQRARFLLLVKTQDFGRAIQTFETLSEYPLDDELLNPLRAVVDELETLRLDDRGYSVPGDFGDRYTWSYQLFKDEFFLADVEGQIEEIKLRCARKYVFLRFDPDLQYKIEREYLPCHLQLVGDPGTTFRLIQF
ncbi:MAG: energy transducer TonB [Gammaproteobacteria bacterium]|nr:energy transducer TonB [Gammaproteobacteria bacterium]